MQKINAIDLKILISTKHNRPLQRNKIIDGYCVLILAGEKD